MPSVKEVATPKVNDVGEKTVSVGTKVAKGFGRFAKAVGKVVSGGDD
eukprot:CAMPEP_0114604680 /NCGR_PEP_ID=MMETSP0168-20121206/670_1 /TAXON_ID=95228 ORGANISM="Vannella sp., Strain DIVA3 517/6/12" /NCGR_SAMPLE_ID=MMETSP0168 /ASSEMBLY_ACC=CAM_ASM_000044 /LENGTH=46 /DNA_ID= /DNA_START= /DNA_END= /DNA_ORIENTATION=